MPKVYLSVGVTWCNPVAGLTDIGHRWDRAGISRAAAGTTAASVLAPYLTTVTSSEGYVEASTSARLEWVSANAGLRSTEGGRQVLHPLPTVTAGRLAKAKN